MITNIYLVRHADSTYTKEELTRPLSEKGLKDAKLVTELLLSENITKVLSSPYKRAIQTIEGIALHNNLNIEIDEDFKERKLAKASVENFEETIVKVWEDFDFALSGGETGNTAMNRGISALKKIISKYKGKNIAIGTHGNIMVLMMNYFNKKYNYEFWQKLNMPDIYKLSFKDEELIEVKHIWNE